MSLIVDALPDAALSEPADFLRTVMDGSGSSKAMDVVRF
jgi:hypothetical protein